MLLDELIDTYRQYLYLPDLGPLYAILGTAAANRLPGDPVWLFVVGPPSAGKTELLDPLEGALDEAVLIDKFTQASLLTATPGGQVGGLLAALPQVVPAPPMPARGADRSSPLAHKLEELAGQRRVPPHIAQRLGLPEGSCLGLLIHTDFSVALTGGGSDGVEERFSVMRVLYDGHFSRAIGHQGGMRLTWMGKVGFIAAVTDEIDQHERTMAALGHRYLYVRARYFNRDEMAKFQMRASANVGTQRPMRKALRDVTRRFFSELEATLPSKIEQVPDFGRHHALARLVTLARSTVGRDIQGRLTHVNLPEYPMRLGAQLAQLYAGFRAIGLPIDQAEALVQRIGLDSVPPARRNALHHLVNCGTGVTTETVARATRQVPSLTDAALVDLEAHGLVQRLDDLSWVASDLTLEEWTTAGLPVATASDIGEGNDATL